MAIREIKIKWFFGFAGFTVYPFIFHVGEMSQQTRRHELLHIDQRKRWFKWFTLWYGGLIAWLFMNGLVLPVGWNYCRYKWEYEAYTKGSGYTDDLTKTILKDSYLLFWH